MTPNSFRALMSKDAVVSLQNFSVDGIVWPHPMFTTNQFAAEAENCILNHKRQANRHDAQFATKWLVDGIDCEVLELGATKWKRGKVRLKVCLEFCPEEIEEEPVNFPLDELRQQSRE